MTEVMDVIELTEGRRTMDRCWLLLLLAPGPVVALSVAVVVPLERLPQMSSFLSELSIV